MWKKMTASVFLQCVCLEDREFAHRKNRSVCKISNLRWVEIFQILDSREHKLNSCYIKFIHKLNCCYIKLIKTLLLFSSLEPIGYLSSQASLICRRWQKTSSQKNKRDNCNKLSWLSQCLWGCRSSETLPLIFACYAMMEHWNS